MKTSMTTVTMLRKFNCGADKVFEAWTTPELMKKWFFTMEHTNKVAANDFRIGGSWEIVDHRDGKDYRAIGEYLKIEKPNKLVFTFKMPQFNDLQDEISVEIKDMEKGCEMTFVQGIVVPHEPEWTEEDIEKAVKEYHEQTEQGWGYMFEGLKQLVETGKIIYPEF